MACYCLNPLLGTKKNDLGMPTVPRGAAVEFNKASWSATAFDAAHFEPNR